jgi:hypothetical protein
MSAKLMTKWAMEEIAKIWLTDKYPGLLPEKKGDRNDWRTALPLILGEFAYMMTIELNRQREEAFGHELELMEQLGCMKAVEREVREMEEAGKKPLAKLLNMASEKKQ